VTTIAIVGEAWGAEEEKERTPFVGTSGYHLTKMLAKAGISRADCFLTNVFNLRPKGNRILELCGDRHEGIPGYPALAKSKYVRREFSIELDRLGDELLEVNPNIVICLGNTTMWALSGKTAISKLRGSVAYSSHTVSGFKMLSTYHPAAVLRDWCLRPVVVRDFIKAKRESEYPEVRYPEREIWIEPTVEDLYVFRDRHLRGAKLLSIDIETSGTIVTCIGFAPTGTVGIVIPFVRHGRSYWKDDSTEQQVWKFVVEVLNNSRTQKIFQNGLYDIAFLYRSMGIRVMNAEHDTMLLHHALQPESLKSLNFLGSLYTDERHWKSMRDDRDGEIETIKSED
jgi:uracil-DNA glycosylase